MWQYQGHDLFMDLEEEIRIRVTNIEFSRQKGGPNLTEEELALMAPGSAAGTLAPQVVEAAAAKKAPKKPTIANFEPPMKVIVRRHAHQRTRLNAAALFSMWCSLSACSSLWLRSWRRHAGKPPLLTF